MPDAAETGVMAQAYQALRSMGFKETETKNALVDVQSPGGPNALEAIVREALAVLSPV